jgi:2'-5' RNA ligase
VVFRGKSSKTNFSPKKPEKIPNSLQINKLKPGHSPDTARTWPGRPRTTPDSSRTQPGYYPDMPGPIRTTTTFVKTHIMKLRLFAGITAPLEWKAALTEFRKRTQPKFSDSFGKWTVEANLHLTLRFFGSVEESEFSAISNALQKVASETKSFSVSPGPLGCFPNPSRPRIVWLGLRGATESLIDLESRLRAATAHFGQPPENRDFHPHLTLVRVNEARRSDRDLLAELIRKGPAIETPAWTVTELELIRSELKPGGSVYTVLGRFKLGHITA